MGTPGVEQRVQCGIKAVLGVNFPSYVFNRKFQSVHFVFSTSSVMNKAIEVFLTQLFPEHILLREIFLFSFRKRWFYSNLLVVQGPNLQILTFWKKKDFGKRQLRSHFSRLLAPSFFLFAGRKTLLCHSFRAYIAVGSPCTFIHIPLLSFNFIQF